MTSIDLWPSHNKSSPELTEGTCVQKVTWRSSLPIRTKSPPQVPSSINNLFLDGINILVSLFTRVSVFASCCIQMTFGLSENCPHCSILIKGHLPPNYAITQCYSCSGSFSSSQEQLTKSYQHSYTHTHAHNPIDSFCIWPGIEKKQWKKII